MATRQGDWMAQAERDLAHARHSVDCGDFEWACFAAHQAAEKALKAVFQSMGGQVVMGHSLRDMLQELSTKVAIPRPLQVAARALDRHYIPTRYPDAFPSGAPFQYYRKQEATQAVKYADAIVRFCQGHLA